LERRRREEERKIETYQVPARGSVNGVNLVVGGENNEDLLGSHCV
jgi:hypothetical protein